MGCHPPNPDFRNNLANLIDHHTHCEMDVICDYTTFTNFSKNYLEMCKVYTDVGGKK